MHYTYYDYFTWAVGIPLAMIGLLLVCCIVCTFIFHRRKLNIFLQVLPIITFLLTCMILILIMYPALPFLEELPSEKDEMPLTDVVLVEQLQSVSPLPIYYSNSQKTFFDRFQVIGVFASSFLSRGAASEHGYDHHCAEQESD